MLKVINGKTYNTNTAIKLASWKNEGDFTKFMHVEETLYETKREGNIFLFCQGGFLSEHANYKQYNKTKASENIIPLEFEEAVMWAAKKLTADEFWGIFCPE
jgi:hypothetical protein